MFTKSKQSYIYLAVKWSSVSVLYLLSDKIYISGIYQMYKNCHLCVKTAAVWSDCRAVNIMLASLGLLGTYFGFEYHECSSRGGLAVNPSTFRKCEVCSGIICKSLWKQFSPPTVRAAIPPRMPFFINQVLPSH